MATITVDGKTVEAPAGAPLVEVLKRSGFYVSSLCYIEGLKPYAGCRTCLVDVEGPPGLQLSCTSVVQEGMVVHTDTAEITDARKAVMALILANHSDRCLTCHRREHCHPGDICLRDDVVTHRCITCSKNYRCELQATCEMVGMSGYEPWVGEERSFYQAPQPLADRANPFLEFDPQMCIICTRCQRACDEKRHTGAITLSGKGFETQIAFGAGGPIHDSNCDFCGACIDVCPTAALMEHPNKWVAKTDRWTTTTCDSCPVGCSLAVGSKEGRGVIVRPGAGNPFSGDQVCVRGRFHYDALKPRDRLSKHLVRRGAIQAPVTFEAAVAEAAAALKAAAGKGRVGVLTGGTATNEEAWLAQRIAREAFTSEAGTAAGAVLRATNGALEERLGTWRTAASLTSIPTAKAIVVVHDDIEESHNVASLRVKDAVVRGGAKLVVIGALRSELVDFADIWLHTAPGDEGPRAGELAEALAGRAATGDLARAVELLKAQPSEGTYVVCAPNPVSETLAGAIAAGAANVAVALCGNSASEHLVVLGPEANANGLLDLGIGVNGAPDPLDNLTGLLVFRDEPALRLPGFVEALAGLDAVVVIDGMLHETAKRATAVIAEGRAYSATGTFTTAGFRVQRLAPATVPEGAAVPGFEALRALGMALGLTLPATPDAALAEIARAVPAYQAAADLIVGEGVQLGVSGSGKGTIVPVPPVHGGAGLRLLVTRDLYTAADAAALGKADADPLGRGANLHVSEADAARLGIEDGDVVEVASGDVRIRAAATVTDRVPAGAVVASSLLQGGAAARLFAGGAVPGVTLAKAAPATAVASAR